VAFAVRLIESARQIIWRTAKVVFPVVNLTHTQWIINFVLDSIHTQSIICTLPHLTLLIPLIDIFFYSYPPHLRWV
jgi:hypothetical protein